jgi:hypothetical protein
VIPENFGSSLPHHVIPPHGRFDLYRFVGFDKDRHVRDDGRFSPDFERAHIVRVHLPLSMVFAGSKITRVACHVKIATYTVCALTEIAEADLWPFVERYGGGFCPRLVRGGGDWSTHSFGMAFDFDPDRNPLGAPPEESFLGSTTGGRLAIDIFTRWGFLWGGYFDSRKDTQHFQFCTGC